MRPAVRETHARAVDFLLGARSGADPLWHDFTSTAGPSTEWASAFALWGLGPGQAARTAVRARAALLAAQRPDGSWGFNRVVPGDADSTAWAVIALRSALPAAARASARSYLLRQQVPNGGFRTYDPSDLPALEPWAPPATTFAGWTSAHTCVTAAVVGALRALDEPADSPSIAAATRFLLARQDRSGLWPSYWWSGVAYATCVALEALRHAGRLERARREAAARALARRQRRDGSWGWDGRPRARGCAFETAFAAAALRHADDGAARAAALRWLCREQDRSGRWTSSPVLRVPHPDDAVERLGAGVSPVRRGGLGTDESGVLAAAAAMHCLGSELAHASRTVRRQARDVARAAFATALAERGLAMPPDVRQRIVTRDRTLGASIARQLPRAPRAAGSVFPDDWRRRTVGSLGFGAAMTRVLATAQDVPPSNEASELGAVLFMGTSAFDHVCDRSTSRRRELLALVNGDALAALARGTGGDLEARDPDVRYVLGYVHAFFARFSRWVPEGPARARALALLHDAYAAERRTFEPDEAVSAAVSVRTLTFATTSAIICAVGRHECGDAHRCEEQARRLGRAAAILDDLADLASDARTGAPNSLLARRTLADVLSDGTCTEAARSVTAGLAAFARLLPDDRRGREARARLLAHMSGWGSLNV